MNDPSEKCSTCADGAREEAKIGVRQKRQKTLFLFSLPDARFLLPLLNFTKPFALNITMEEFIDSEGMSARLADGRDYRMSCGGCQPPSADLV